MAMASETGMDHSSMDMDMNMDGGMTMEMKDMAMTFFTSAATPLYADSWTPANSGQYAGTCIFLIVLSVVFRALLVLRCEFPALLSRARRFNDTDILRREEAEDGALKPEADPRRPWNINEALLRAVLDTVLAGVSYLLMLAVMTMNVGYFMSILGGTFLGSFVLGGWTPVAVH